MIQVILIYFGSEQSPFCPEWLVKKEKKKKEKYSYNPRIRT